MPELPEVETTVRGLSKKVLKRTFVGVWSDWTKLIKKPKSFKDFEKDLKNKKIIKVWRRAKNVIFDLSPANFGQKNKHELMGSHKNPKLAGDKSGGYSLLIHQKMTGHLLVGKWKLINGKWKPQKEGPLSDPYNRFLHLIFFLDDKNMMALSDARKFAKVELWKTDDLLSSPEFKKIGPEPLEKNFTFQKFKEVLKNKKGRVKQVIMNPEIIAGIGNIYASEALWVAKIHPEKNVARLSLKELESLYQAIRKVLALSVKLGGESFSDYRKPDGTKGDFDTERRAYKREGQKCHRCGTKIKRIKFGGRSAFFCPKCQS